MTPLTILWIYIVLLVVGGLIGFVKAKSKISLYMSLGFAIALSLCALGILPRASCVTDGLLALLLIVFGMRFAKIKKFMPAGMMLLLTILALALQHLL